MAACGGDDRMKQSYSKVVLINAALGPWELPSLKHPDNSVGHQHPSLKCPFYSRQTQRVGPDYTGFEYFQYLQ